MHACSMFWTNPSPFLSFQFFSYPSSLSLPNFLSPPLSPHLPPSYLLLFLTPAEYTHGCGAISWGHWWLLRACIPETERASLDSHQLSIVSQLRVWLHDAPTTTHAGLLAGLTWGRSCTHSRSCCEFMCATISPCLTNRLGANIYSLLFLRSLHHLFSTIPESSGTECNIDVFLELNTPKSLIFFIFANCGSLSSTTTKKKVILMRTERHTSLWV